MHLTLPYPADVATFAQTIQKLARRHTTSDNWRPGAQASDHNPDLVSGLTDAGWFELPAEGPTALPHLGTGGYELGRRCAPYDCITPLLGGAPLAGELVTYGKTQRVAVILRPDNTLAHREIIASQPLPYTDNVGMHRVLRFGASDRTDGTTRLVPWLTATIGYFAGLTAACLDTAHQHAVNRSAFGTTLSALAAVQHKLADSALIAESLRLSATHAADPLPALAYATTRSREVAAHAHQILGATGFTLEHPLQRHTRRINALSTLFNTWLTATP